ncbi:MAG: hypothetical protein ACPG4T_01360 [Nannocystaceae bacterium]
MDNNGNFTLLTLAGALGAVGLFCLTRSRNQALEDAELEQVRHDLKVELATLRHNNRELDDVRRATQILGQRVDNLFAIHAKG